MQQISAASDRPCSPHAASALSSTAAKENRFVRVFCEVWEMGGFGRRAAGWPWTQLQSQWSKRSDHGTFLIPNELPLETTQLLLYQFRLFCLLSLNESASDSTVCRLLARDQRPFFSLLLSLFLMFLCWKTSVTSTAKVSSSNYWRFLKSGASILNLSIAGVEFLLAVLKLLGTWWQIQSFMK